MFVFNLAVIDFPNSHFILLWSIHLMVEIYCLMIC